MPFKMKKPRESFSSYFKRVKAEEKFTDVSDLCSIAWFIFNKDSGFSEQRKHIELKRFEKRILARLSSDKLWGERQKKWIRELARELTCKK